MTKTSAGMFWNVQRAFQVVIRLRCFRREEGGWQVRRLIPCGFWVFSSEQLTCPFPGKQGHITMASGFSQPLLGLAAFLLLSFLAPSRTYAVVWIVLVFLLFEMGDRYAKRIARQQTLVWCRQNGFGDLRWKKRGGFVTWSWSFWTRCELLPCEFESANGEIHDAMVDMNALAFGLIVRTKVLTRNCRPFPDTNSGEIGDPYFKNASSN
jgi:hypothetical protein